MPESIARTSNDRLRAALALGVAGGMLLCCSCLGGMKSVSNDPFLQTPSIGTAPAAPIRTAQRPSTLVRGASQASDSTPAAAGVVRLTEWQVPAASKTSARQHQIEQAIYQTPTIQRSNITTAAFHPDSIGPAPVCHICNSSTCKHCEVSRVRLDEFLCDGGDRDLPVHFDRFNRLGLDTEDTVAEYSDHLGDRHVKPSNTVCVYSPRFAAVLTVTGPDAGTSVEQFVLSSETSRSAGLRNRRTPLDRTQHDAAGRLHVRSRPSGIESEASRQGVQQTMRIVLYAKPVKAAEDLSFVGSGRFLQTERARLASSIQAAVAWSRTDSPIILAKADGAQEAYSFFKPQELIGDEDQKTPGDLRIVKLADRKVAQPGDTITFTIRYDNLGDRELHHIRIIDNLTPRLEFVEGSGTSDRDGRLEVEDNGEGSLVLTFIVDDPLPGHDGGVVTFKALVR